VPKTITLSGGAPVTPQNVTSCTKCVATQNIITFATNCNNCSITAFSNCNKSL